MAVQPRIHIDGLGELRRELRRVGGRPLQKELGQVHKSIGEMVIARAGGKQTGVGEGRGATIRPSAAVGSVMLRVGGKHRDMRRRQWGANQRWPGGMPPTRPHLIGAALEIQDRIEREYMAGVEQVLRSSRMLR